MAILTRPKIESAHWYDAKGRPVHTQLLKSGKGTRPTHLGDARKLGLFPSVTGILKIFAKPQLEKWKLNQVALAAFATRKRGKEDEGSRVQRAINSAFEQVDKAADYGVEVHKMVEENQRDGTPIPEQHKVALDPVIDFHSKINVVEHELTVINLDHGFAGTMDEAFTFGQAGLGVLDLKTRRTKEGVKVKSYDFQAMQIAAYGATYWAKKKEEPYNEVLKRMIGANLYISSTEPGRMDVVKYSSEQLFIEWQAFILACALWRYINDFDPRTNAERIGMAEEDSSTYEPELEEDQTGDDPEHDQPVIRKKKYLRPRKKDTSDITKALTKTAKKKTAKAAKKKASPRKKSGEDKK